MKVINSSAVVVILDQYDINSLYNRLQEHLGRYGANVPLQMTIDARYPRLELQLCQG